MCACSGVGMSFYSLVFADLWFATHWKASRNNNTFVLMSVWCLHYGRAQVLCFNSACVVFAACSVEGLVCSKKRVVGVEARFLNHFYSLYVCVLNSLYLVGVPFCFDF